LVSEGTEQQEQDQDIEMNGVDKTHEYEEPLLRQETRLQLEEARPLESSTESFDPLYERVKRSVTVDVQPGPSTEKDERPQVEPVYAQVSCMCCSSISSLVQFLFSFVLFYVNI